MLDAASDKLVALRVEVAEEEEGHVKKRIKRDALIPVNACSSNKALKIA